MIVKSVAHVRQPTRYWPGPVCPTLTSTLVANNSFTPLFCLWFSFKAVVVFDELRQTVWWYRRNWNSLTRKLWQLVFRYPHIGQSIGETQTKSIDEKHWREADYQWNLIDIQCLCCFVWKWRQNRAIAGVDLHIIWLPFQEYIHFSVTALTTSDDLKADRNHNSLDFHPFRNTIGTYRN